MVASNVLVALRARIRALLGAFASTLAALAVLGAAAGATTSAESRAARIRQFANRWLGTPYQWGGDSHAGIDCSGYVREMFRETFRIDLPRTTKQQINLGKNVRILPTALEQSFRSGDLVFYIDPAGVPNHVVVYVGSGQITQSVSGQGVVIDPLKVLWGRRIVVRRVLPQVSGGDDDLSGMAAIPAAGPIVPQAIPCPPSVVAVPSEVRRFQRQPIEDMKGFGTREICDFRALARALRAHPSPTAIANASRLEAHAVWLESIDALKGSLDPSGDGP